MKTRTILTYFFDYPNPNDSLCVGEAACVPRQGERVRVGDINFAVRSVNWLVQEVDPNLDVGITRVAVDLYKMEH
jgi:hypothetical protein